MHLPPLAPEILFHLGSFPITNSLVNALLATLLLVALILVFRRHALSDVPRGLQNVLESIIETFLSGMDQVTNDRKKSELFFPIVGTLFFFILVSNWLGIFPGIGSITRTVEEHGEIIAAPLLRPANTDLNLTLGMAMLSVIASHILGAIIVGGWAYADRFIRLGTIWKSFRKGPMAVLVAIIEFFVGLIEIIAEFAKMLSLSLRLFGNIFAGEVLLTVMAALIPFVVPLPFMLMEILVGAIQATVFAMLTLVYLTIATTPTHEEGHDDERSTHSVTEAHPTT